MQEESSDRHRTLVLPTPCAEHMQAMAPLHSFGMTWLALEARWWSVVDHSQHLQKEGRSWILLVNLQMDTANTHHQCTLAQQEQQEQCRQEQSAREWLNTW